MGSLSSMFFMSIGSAAIALIGFVIVHRVFKPINLEEHSQFLDAMLNIVGTLVSILLGLLVAAALDHYQSIAESVDSEASNLSEVFRLTVGLPEDIRLKLRKTCLEYGNAVVNDEWPAMEKGQASKKVLIAYFDLLTQVANFRPSNDGESNLHSALLQAVQEIGDCRRKRLLALHSKWTTNLMPMLLTCSFIVLTFAYLYARRGAIFHGVLICFVAIALGGNLGLVFVLRNPFAGDWKIQPRGFQLNNMLLQTMLTEPDLRKKLEEIKLEEPVNN